MTIDQKWNLIISYLLPTLSKEQTKIKYTLYKLVLEKLIILVDDMKKAQIREQMLVPDLYVFTLKFEIPQQPIKKD